MLREYYTTKPQARDVRGEIFDIIELNEVLSVHCDRLNWPFLE
jgi:hypothetical protein